MFSCWLKWWSTECHCMSDIISNNLGTFWAVHDMAVFLMPCTLWSRCSNLASGIPIEFFLLVPCSLLKVQTKNHLYCFDIFCLMKPHLWDSIFHIEIAACILFNPNEGKTFILLPLRDSSLRIVLVLQIFYLWHPFTLLQQAPLSAHQSLYNATRGHTLPYVRFQQRICRHRYVAFLLAGPLLMALDCLLTFPA